MIRNRFTLKSVAAFLILETLFNTVAPTISWALTAGPTAPEATSFEPVDTTDLVDLKTGDFTYGLPLLEVPGPGGGYPISLAYHAGILADVEASWTGLGFTLNPGSITRFVNGYPDDHKVASNATREFWEGEETETTTVGISVGVGKVASVSADLIFADNTYKGRGVGWGMGASLGIPLTDNSQLGVSANWGQSPYGETHSSIGLSLGVGKTYMGQFRAQANIGVTLNSSGKVSAGLSAGVSWQAPGETRNNSASLVEGSISTNGSSPTLSAAGIPSTIHQQNFGRVSSIYKSWQVDIPVYYFNIRLGRSYQRAWIDETDNAITYGSLYLAHADPGYNVAFDTHDYVDTDLDLVDYGDGEKVLGGSFPAVDSYVVTGQGISGSIQPFNFQEELYAQDKKDKDNHDLAKSYPLTTRERHETTFGFINDFSNRFEYDPGNFAYQSENSPADDVLSFSFTDDYITGKDGHEGYADRHLAQSRHVDWFSNRSIQGSNPGEDPFADGFIDAVAEGFQRDNNDQIGGFSITNASGVTYHYALPAYSFEEMIKSQNTAKQQQEGGLYYNEIKKPEKYAHTWHLTTITGSDFIDRNENHIADEGDWGYWVRFEYKKWIDDYKWRNPGQGLHKDLDNDFEFFSGGKKELYCLTRIATETHTALFSTSARIDGREVASIRAGGFDPTPVYTVDPEYINCVNACQDPTCNGNCEQMYPDKLTGYTNIPRPTFRLDEIKLYSAEDYFSNNLGDARVLRAIHFDYDYDLALNTLNSFSDDDPTQKKGRLTLHAVHFQGKGKEELIPPVRFEYSKNPGYQQDFSDMWGYYKKDYVANDNKNIAELTTPASAEDVDAWSMTTVNTSLGAKIMMDYESDEYNTPALYRNNIISVQGLEVIPERHSVKLTINPTGFDLTTIEALLRNSNAEFLIRQLFNAKQYCICQGKSTFPNGAMGNYYPSISVEFSESNILGITPTSIEFKADELYTLLTQENENGVYTETTCYDLDAKEINPAIRISAGVLASGNVVVKPNISTFGGGLRVKEIAVQNGGEISTTVYEYRNGVTSYEPVNFGKVNFDFPTKLLNTWTAEVERIKDARNAHTRKLYESFFSILGASESIPGPGVMYGEVKVSQNNKTADGQVHRFPNYMVYQFETFKDGMVGFVKSPVQTIMPTNSPSFSRIKTRALALKDYTARVGNLKSVVTYNSENNQPVSSVESTYLHDNLDGSFDQNTQQYENSLSTFANNQGLIEQSFSRARVVLYQKDSSVPYPQAGDPQSFANDERHLLGIISKLERFPSILTGQKTKNFKTGMESESRNIAFDFYSGEPLQVASTDSYGNRYLSVAVPAYQKYGGMGLKVDDKHNKQMLTQTAYQANYLVDDQNAVLGVLSASIQTWSKSISMVNVSGSIPGIWKKQASYQWNSPEELNGDGTFKKGDLLTREINWDAPDANDQWEKMGEITLTDIYSHGLEGKDINGQFASSRFDNRQQRVIASAINSTYEEMACSGAEYSINKSDQEGGIDRGQGSPTTAFAHTGKFSLMVSNGAEGFNRTFTTAKKYKASVWVYAPGVAESQNELEKIQLYYRINGVETTVHPTLQKNKAKSWYLLTIDIYPGQQSQVRVGVRNQASREVYFDDFRVHPLNAAVTAFVYDQVTGELSHILDANNFYTMFEYDAMGRLVRTKKELLNFDFGDGKESYRADAVLNEYRYNYGND